MIYHNHKETDAHKNYGEVYHLDDLELTVRDTVEDLRPHRREFDSIVVTGMSGVIVGAPVALRLKKPLVILRKAKDGSHSGTPWINLAKLGQRTLWLDDFEATGDTRYRVQQEVTKQRAQIVQQYLYRDRTLDNVKPSFTVMPRIQSVTEIPF